MLWKAPSRRAALAARWVTPFLAACGEDADFTWLDAERAPPAATTLLDQAEADAAGSSAESAASAGARAIAPARPVVPGVLRRERMATACSFGAVQGTTALIARRPYLQRVSATSAVVAFTTHEPGVDVTLRLARPGSSEQQRLSSTSDPSDASGLQRLVQLDGLEPDSAYCYQLEGVRAAGFRTPPRAGAGAAVRFIAFGDSGGSSRQSVRAAMDVVPFDLMLHTGDIAYPAGKLADYEAQLFATYAELLATTPFFPSSGNHDYASDGAATFRQVFVLPENGAPAGRERWYSFDWGDVHFVALDTERLHREQSAWLERDLAATALPWKIAYMHRPPHSSGTHGGSPAVEEAFTPVFAAHGVQLVLAGHDHDYERTGAIDGVTYVVSGGGGYSVRPVGSSDFTQLSASRFHFVQGEVGGATLTLRAIGASGEVFDRVTIARQPR